MSKRTTILALLVIVTAVSSLGPAHALWESRSGSSPWPFHCKETLAPTWGPPGLVGMSTDPYHNGSWASLLLVLDAEETPWLDQAERVVLAAGKRVHAHDENMQPLWSKAAQLAGGFTAVREAHRIEPGGELRLYAEERILDLQGNALVVFQPEPPLVPPILAGFDYSDGWRLPAIGDFTSDGVTDLIVPGWREWQAYRADGTLIARSTVVDPYDGGSSAFTSRTGNDPNFFVYSHNLDTPFEWRMRLHKVNLSQNPLPVDMPYMFAKQWAVDFDHAANINDRFLHDLTGDGFEELVLPFWAGGPPLRILDQTGQTLHEAPGDDWYAPSVAIGDVDGDGTPEVVFVTVSKGPAPATWEAETWVTGIQWNGASFQEGYRIQVDDQRTDDWNPGEFNGLSPLALCDLDGDGASEILVGSGQVELFDEGQDFRTYGKSMLLKGDGTMLWEYPHLLGGPALYVIDDVTGDGYHEILIATTLGQVLMFSSAVEPSPSDYTRPIEALLAAGLVTAEEADEAFARLGELGLLGAEQRAGTSLVPLLVVATVTAVLFALRRSGRRFL